MIAIQRRALVAFMLLITVTACGCKPPRAPPRAANKGQPSVGRYRWRVLRYGTIRLSQDIGRKAFDSADIGASTGEGPFVWLTEDICIDMSNDDVLAVVPNLTQDGESSSAYSHPDGLFSYEKRGWNSNFVPSVRLNSSLRVFRDGDFLPLAEFSLTRDGKRLRVPCDEKAIREAFGEPDEIELH